MNQAAFADPYTNKLYNVKEVHFQKNEYFSQREVVYQNVLSTVKGHYRKALVRSSIAICFTFLYVIVEIYGSFKFSAA